MFVAWFRDIEQCRVMRNAARVASVENREVSTVSYLPVILIREVASISYSPEK